MTDKVISDMDRNIIQAQMARRANMRKQFLKLRTDPCKHFQEAGFVFDKSLQQFISMKVCQTEYFYGNPKTIMMGVAGILPMFIYGYFVHKQKSEFERDCRCGKLRYRDRIFKLH